MLVLSRKIGESILIGDNIIITIQRIGCNRVAVGVEAPQEVAIKRTELEEKPSSRPHGWPAGRPAPV